MKTLALAMALSLGVLSYTVLPTGQAYACGESDGCKDDEDYREVGETAAFRNSIIHDDLAKQVEKINEWNAKDFDEDSHEKAEDQKDSADRAGQAH